jgi:predicted permease
MNDLRFALRQLAKSPGFTAIALLTLALGIGLNTSMFSLMNLLILKPLPYPDVAQLSRIYRTNPQSNSAEHSASDSLELQRETKDFAQVAAFLLWGYTFSIDGRPPTNVNACRVSGNFLPTLGLQPLLGRWFTAEEDQPGNHVIILSYETWQAQFGGDPSVIGRSVRVDGESMTIVGVMPVDFSSVFLWGPADILRPMGLTAAEKENLGEMKTSLIARRAPGVSLEQFNARLATVAQQLKETRPANRSEDGLRAVSLESLAHNINSKLISWLMLGLAGFVLLIACANLANLQLARAVARSHEFAIRAALGASHSRLLRPQLVESLVLSLVGGVLGVLVAVWANDWLASRLAATGVFRITLSLDWRVLTFALALAAFTSVLFGLVPAWRVSRVRGYDALKSNARGNTGDRAQNRLQRALIVSQFANALVLLVTAVSFISGVDQLVNVTPGWDQEKILQAVIKLPDSEYSTPEQITSFHDRVEENLRALPGAENATVAYTLPVFQYLTNRSIVAQGQPPVPAGHEPVAYINGVSPSYLPTLGIKLQSGRNFNATDTLRSVHVAIINASLAQTLFAGENPIGRRIGNPDPANPAWLEIVGVVPDVERSVGAVPSASSFLILRPITQEPWTYFTVALRSSNPTALAEPMRQIIASLDPDISPTQFGTIENVTRLVTGVGKTLSTVLLCFALLGLFLASIGIYGVIARIVVQRTPEIGVRIALGAQLRDVVHMILFSGLRMTLLGTAIGLAGAFALGWVLRQIMPASGSSNPLLVVAVTLGLIAIGLLACWLPARRAARIDPITALRAE